MNLQKRIDLLVRTGQYILDNPPEWRQAKARAHAVNNWFISEFIDNASNSIANQYLQPDKLTLFTEGYFISRENLKPKTVGVVMAGNIPLVGFHDWLCIFLAGHHSMVKLSFKDELLIRHLVDKICEWEPDASSQTTFTERLNGCDAYIATGSNNSARYFDYYFGKYPNIIRRNKTGVAILTGEEDQAALEKLADDVHLYFGLGCRNITKLYAPKNYDFVPLLEACKKYAYFTDHHKYRNNYDYQLAIHLINYKLYMTNGSVLLSENTSVFSPISQVNYELYEEKPFLAAHLRNNPDIQCISGNGFIPFGQTQQPSLTNYADQVDTMKFLLDLV